METWLIWVASEYDNVPGHLKTDNVMPSASDLPNIIDTIRHPGRRASISVGPQSEADAYEALAFRQRKRRESLSSVAETKTPRYRRAEHESQPQRNTGLAQSTSTGNGVPTQPVPQIPNQSNINRVGDNLQASSLAVNPGGLVRTPSQNRREAEKDEKEIFSKIEKPRVRYDVEVITKMIVYSGQLHLGSSGYKR